MSGGLKEVRNRITSVQSTRQITQAMKMVSAAKLRRAQDAITRMRPYASKLQEILSNVSATLDASEGVYSVQREENKILIVAITSNRGLCGAFNNNVIKETNRLIKEDYAGKDVKVLCLGKKADDAFKSSPNYHREGFEENPFTIFDNLTFEEAGNVASVVMDQFETGMFDKVVVIYNQFKNAGVQILSNEQMLPVVPAESEDSDTSAAGDYIFEPNRQFIIETMIPNSIRLQLFKALLDSHASEHGARMTAMHKATDNATDLIRDLKLTYNKARQASITNEILEIVGGAEALNG